MTKTDSLRKILVALGGKDESQDDTVVELLEKITKRISNGGGSSVTPYTLNYMGSWVNKNEYHLNDIVIDNDNLYICVKSINPSTVEPHLDNVNWELFASRLQINTLEIEVNDVPASATSGTITPEQLKILQSSDYASIMFNHERFVLMDKAHTEGFLTYTHVGVENNSFWLKSFTITLATRGWVLTKKEVI